jgi:uncharacterized protein (DUF2141 family)
MKWLMIVLVILMCLVSAWGQTLTISITNIKNSKGQIAVALYKEEKDFMKKHWLIKVAKANTGMVELNFDTIPAGFYAISVMHDANNNDKLDSNLIGIPKEGFGFSNNAMGKFGPPSFEKAKIKVISETQISIAMKYL